MQPTFLTLDEITEIHCDQIARYGELVLSVACGETPKSAVAEFFRENVVPVGRQVKDRGD
jgi:hypothetical protein